MAQAILVTDKDGNDVLVMTRNIKSVEGVPAEPEEPAVEAQDAVEDDPGEEPSATNPTGRAPKKGHGKIEAKAGKPGKPASAIIHTEDGSHEVGLSVRHLLNLINN